MKAPVEIPRKAVILAPGEGRAYPMGRIGSVFKADGPETESRYSISEWWLEPHTRDPGAHAHPEDDIRRAPAGECRRLVPPDPLQLEGGRGRNFRT